MGRWNWASLTLATRYNLASLGVLLLSMGLTGWWVGAQISQGVIHRTAAATALYVENFLVLQLQELGSAAWLSPARVAAIQRLLATTPLGQEIVGIKIWAPDGRVVYGENAGQTFPVKADLETAWRGQVSSEITNLQDSENASQRGRRLRNRTGLVAQPLPEHRPVFLVVRGRHPQGGPVIERRMETDD